MPLSVLSEIEIQAAKQRRLSGEASLACEGLYLTDEQKARFDRFERERLSHDECLKQIVAHYCEQQRRQSRIGA